MPSPVLFAGRTRLATTDDSSSIAAIYNEGIRARAATFETTDRKPEDIVDWLDLPNYPVVVAEHNGRVTGWSRASEYRPRLAYSGIREFSVYVTESARGHGVGTALIQALVTECERVGCYKLVSRIFPNNVSSRALCRTNGFREVGTYERHGVLDGQWRDVIIVERLIGVGRQ